MLPLLAALLAAACPLSPGLLGAPPNASANASSAAEPPEPRPPASASPAPPQQPGPAAAAADDDEDREVAPSCNISVQRPMASSLLVRWGRPRGPPCDLLLFSTSARGRAVFAAAFHRVGSPLHIEHPGLAAGGAQHDLRLCVGCHWGRGRPGERPRPPEPPEVAGGSPPAALRAPRAAAPWPFCCLDFSLEELQGDAGWRLNRKPIESTLVACFMTLVIVVWSVAALIWPVPIIAGFLPNGMEQRRTPASAPAASAPAGPAGTPAAATPELAAAEVAATVTSGMAAQ
ncbi:transmembrane protein 158 [Ctenodactylus gundi]